jgi:hypothetical protein
MSEMAINTAQCILNGVVQPSVVARALLEIGGYAAMV